MLQIENASIAYGDRVLFSGFNLELHGGEMASISGPSGCGKTSLLNAVLGFIPLREGSITVNGILLGKSTIDHIRKHMAWIPQELALPSEWVKEMVKIPFELKANRVAPFSEERLLTCFEELGLERGLYEKRINEISGGQRQRMMIAVAALMNKPLMVVDEPTSALDAEATGKVLAFLHRQTEKGSAVLAVSHDEAFTSGCQKQIVMK